MSINCCPIACYMECLPMSFYDALIHFKITAPTVKEYYTSMLSNWQTTAVREVCKPRVMVSLG